MNKMESEKKEIKSEMKTENLTVTGKPEEVIVLDESDEEVRYRLFITYCVFSKEFLKVCHLSLASSRLLLVAQ